MRACGGSDASCPPLRVLCMRLLPFAVQLSSPRVLASCASCCPASVLCQTRRLVCIRLVPPAAQLLTPRVHAFCATCCPAVDPRVHLSSVTCCPLLTPRVHVFCATCCPWVYVICARLLKSVNTIECLLWMSRQFTYFSALLVAGLTQHSRAISGSDQDCICQSHAITLCTFTMLSCDSLSVTHSCMCCAVCSQRLKSCSVARRREVRVVCWGVLSKIWRHTRAASEV